MNRHPQQAQRFQIPIDRMGVKGRSSHDQIVKATRAFARVIETDGQLTVGQPRKRSAARQALQIDHPIELESAHAPNTGQQFVPVQR